MNFSSILQSNMKKKIYVPGNGVVTSQIIVTYSSRGDLRADAVHAEYPGGEDGGAGAGGHGGDGVRFPFMHCLTP